MEHLDDDLNTLDELEEDAIEVKPELQRTENLANRSLRNSTVVDDDPDGKKQFRFMYLEVLHLRIGAPCVNLRCFSVGPL